MSEQWNVEVLTTPRRTRSRDSLGAPDYDNMTDALERFMREVCATIRYVTTNHPEEASALDDVRREFVEEDEETRDAFRGFLVGSPERNIPGADVLKVVIESPVASWLHVMARVKSEGSKA